MTTTFKIIHSNQCFELGVLAEAKYDHIAKGRPVYAIRSVPHGVYELETVSYFTALEHYMLFTEAQVETENKYHSWAMMQPSGPVLQ